MPLYKNTASQKIPVYAWDSAKGAPKTGDAANITAYISKDGGTAAATNDANPTELDATNMPGIYIFDMTQAETNAALVMLSPKSSTSGIHIEPVIIYTVPETPSVNVTQISGDSTAADNLESYCDGTTPQPVNVTQISGDSTAADNCESMFDGTGYAGGSTKLDVNVTSQENIDFGATQKASIGTAVETRLTAANTELAAIPTTISGLRAMIQFLFQKSRNQSDMNKNTGVETMYKEDASTPLGTATHSDDGTTVTKGEFN